MANKKATIGIIGLGKFGMTVAMELVRGGRNIVCIDKDEKKVKKALDFCDYAFVSEDLSKETLEETGFKECEKIVICIGEKLDTAIFACLSALSLNPNGVICMAQSDEAGMVLEKLGAEVIYPYKDTANALVKRILTNNVLDFISLNDEVEICEVKVPSAYEGKSIKDTDIRTKYGINIIAIEIEDRIITRIDPNYILSSNDVLLVLGEKKYLRKFEGKK